ncbi:MAG: STAS domain-containing protein [Syntrophaceae bacterium]
MRNSNEKRCVIETRIANQNITVLEIRGTLNAACNKDLAEAFQSGIKKSHNILLNLSDLLHINTAGAGLLAISTSRADQKNLAVAAWGLKDPFRDVFRLTRLDEAIVFFDTEKEALQCAGSWKKIARTTGASPPTQEPLVPGWARSVDHLSVKDIPDMAMNINVNGRQTTGPVTGFGRLWDKRYRLRIKDINMEPQQIISLWRSEFATFWPPGNYFYPSGRLSVSPGTQAVLNLALPGCLVLATGLMVIYADDTSFSFITIQGHILSGWITFSSFREDSSTIIQVNPLFRASDPLMEMGLRFGAAKQEDIFWHKTLGNLARRLGVSGEISQDDVLIDPCVRWSECANIWYSAAIRSSFYMPLYVLKRMMK